MIPTSFKYKKAGSVEDAIGMLNGDAKILAGGHSLIPAMKLRMNSPETLVDISKISSLQTISMDGDHLVIGAGCTHGQIAASSEVRDTLAMVADASGMIGDIQVRNKGTIGGSIAHADPAADWPGVLMAANASVVCQGAGGSRTVSADDFFTGFFTTALEEGEIITEIRIPKSTAGNHSAYAKFVQPASRFAIVGCAVNLQVDNGSCTAARVAFNGVADAAYRASSVESALVGKAVTADSIAAAVEGAAEGQTVMGDHFASEKYRTHIAKVYAKRALQAATGGGASKSSSAPDDLTKVEGIGPKIQELLNANGIHTFTQLAGTGVMDIKDILKEAGGFMASRNPGTWPEQAKMAAQGRWDELKKWQDELDGGV